MNRYLMIIANNTKEPCPMIPSYHVTSMLMGVMICMLEWLILFSESSQMIISTANLDDPSLVIIYRQLMGHSLLLMSSECSHNSYIS